MNMQEIVEVRRLSIFLAINLKEHNDVQDYHFK
jgi:hypothetical protein